jgi:uncharacterized protein YqjF (DUF2071 family)
VARAPALCRAFPLSNFSELNVRTHVTAEDKPGIWFFSLDARNPIAVRLARAAFSLPCFDAEMSCCVAGARYVTVASARTGARRRRGSRAVTGRWETL